jgi:hypothetical protein
VSDKREQPADQSDELRKALDSTPFVRPKYGRFNTLA